MRAGATQSRKSGRASSARPSANPLFGKSSIEHVVDAGEQDRDRDLRLHPGHPEEDLVLIEREIGEHQPGGPRSELEPAADPVRVHRRRDERDQRDETERDEAAAVGDQLPRQRDQHRESRGKAVDVPLAQVVDQADAVGRVLGVLDGDDARRRCADRSSPRKRSEQPGPQRSLPAGAGWPEPRARRMR